MHNEATAKARGKEAMQKVVSERDKRVFELEMKRLQVKEGMIKIKETRKGEEHVSSVMQERKEKQRKEKMLKMFEEEVIVKTTKLPSSRGPSQGRMLLKV